MVNVMGVSVHGLCVVSVAWQQHPEVVIKYVGDARISCKHGKPMYFVLTSFLKRIFGLIEPRCERSDLRDFRPGPTQTGL